MVTGWCAACRIDHLGHLHFLSTGSWPGGPIAHYEQHVVGSDTDDDTDYANTYAGLYHDSVADTDPYEAHHRLSTVDCRGWAIVKCHDALLRFVFVR